MLYSTEEQSKQNIYMMLIVILILTQDEQFRRAVHEIVSSYMPGACTVPFLVVTSVLTQSHWTRLFFLWGTYWCQIYHLLLAFLLSMHTPKKSILCLSSISLGFARFCTLGFFTSLHYSDDITAVPSSSICNDLAAPVQGERILTAVWHHFVYLWVHWSLPPFLLLVEFWFAALPL